MSQNHRAGRAPGRPEKPVIGLIATGFEPVRGQEAAYRAFLELRRAVYVDEQGFLDGEDEADRFETDEDDARSLAFAAVEHGEHGPRVVAALRLIVKGYAGADDRLPVEQHWPEVFGARPAPVPSVEVSRLIGRHPDRAAQHRCVLELYTAVLAFLDEAGLHVAYGLIDPVLERVLRQTLSVDRIGDRRWIEHYRSHNVAVAIRVPRVRRLSRWLPGEYVTASEILLGSTGLEELAA